LVSNTGMRNRPSRLLLPLAVLVILTGCATRASMDARYDQSLQRWKGATRAELVAAWGPPTLVQPFLNEVTLTWTRNDDLHPGQPLPAYSPAFGSMAGAAPMVNAPTAAPTVPMRCTTRFTLRNDIVVGWKFDGLACGAPS
jgi:hypothetical protein